MLIHGCRPPRGIGVALKQGGLGNLVLVLLPTASSGGCGLFF
jgi:hypothetical protein